MKKATTKKIETENKIVPTTTKKGLLANIIKAHQAIKQHLKLHALSAVIDLTFFFLFSGIATWAITTMQEPLNKIYDIAGENISKLALNMTDTTALASLMESQTQFLAYYAIVVKTALIFYLGATLLWLALQGINWAIAHKISGDTIEIKKYAKRFTILTMSASLGLLGVIYLGIKLGTILNLNRAGDTLAMVSSALSALLFLTVLYFLFCGYACQPSSEAGATWKIAGAGWKKMIPTYLVALFIVYGLNIILAQLFTRWPSVGIAFGILIVAPAYAYNRVLLIMGARQC